uniref:Prolyl 4-hydroxylase alpha subunit Fe(2+) 2OG dioxygenase domain-containing protein n=1 Tax=viral metagenome TaxID=1070528 RepID=A0A6C0JS97_9ZZZZ
MNTSLIKTPEEYQSMFPYPHMFQDNFLDENQAKEIQHEILSLPDSAFDRYDNPFEQKFTLRDKFAYPPKLNELLMFLTSDSFVERLSALVGIKLINDPDRNFWGVHKYNANDKLDIHLDAGIHPRAGLTKQVTVGLYLSHNWKEEYGCELEIWKGDKDKLEYLVSKIAPLFNRLVVFTNTEISWHGNPSPVNCPKGVQRIFVTCSYLSEKPQENKRPKAYFVARPGDPEDPEKDKLRLLRCDPVRYKEVYRM